MGAYPCFLSLVKSYYFTCIYSYNYFKLISISDNCAALTTLFCSTPLYGVLAGAMHPRIYPPATGWNIPRVLSGWMVSVA
jgi:hypothetical protein